MGAKWGLVIGHADDPGLLERNVRHHLALGAQSIVVTTIGDDAGAARAVASIAHDRVTHRIVRPNDEDAFLYFELAARDVASCDGLDWIGFIDTDEFIVSADGSLHFANDVDIVALTRFNAVPLLRDGEIGEPELDDLSRTVLTSGSEPIEGAWLAGDTHTPYVEGLDLGAKVIARPRIIQSVTSGGHCIATTMPFVRREVAREALIVHVPFSTPGRFRRKVAGIRRFLAAYGTRFHPWQWLHWAAMSDTELDAEFRRQAGDASASGRGLTDARRILTERRASPNAPPSPLEALLIARSVLYVGMGEADRGLLEFGPIAGTFERSTYVSRYPDIAAAIARDSHFDAFAHFRTFGIAEGRRPSYAFDPAVALAGVTLRLGAPQHVRDVWWLYFALPPAERPIPNDWFDATWFRARHGGSSDWDAFAFYLEHVWDATLSPMPGSTKRRIGCRGARQFPQQAARAASRIFGFRRSFRCGRGAPGCLRRLRRQGRPS